MKKKYIDNSVLVCGKRIQIYLYTLKISICLGVLEIEGNTRQCQ